MVVIRFLFIYFLPHRGNNIYQQNLVQYTFNVTRYGMEHFLSQMESYLQTSLLLSFVAAYLGGLLASLTPCVYPMIPITAGVITNSNLGGSKLHIVTIASDAKIKQYAEPERSASWNSLDATVIHHILFLHLLKLREKDILERRVIRYEQDPRQAIAAVDRGEAQLACILNPTRIEEVLKIAEQGERMPPKATFFYPKVPSGLLINPLNYDKFE